MAPIPRPGGSSSRFGAAPNQSDGLICSSDSSSTAAAYTSTTTTTTTTATTRQDTTPAAKQNNTNLLYYFLTLHTHQDGLSSESQCFPTPFSCSYLIREGEELQPRKERQRTRENDPRKFTHLIGAHLSDLERQNCATKRDQSAMMQTKESAALQLLRLLLLLDWQQ